MYNIQGDSGSAVLCETSQPQRQQLDHHHHHHQHPHHNEDATWTTTTVLAGVVSHAAGSGICGNPSEPSIHTAVAAFVPWIRQYVVN